MGLVDKIGTALNENPDAFVMGPFGHSLRLTAHPIAVLFYVAPMDGVYANLNDYLFENKTIAETREIYKDNASHNQAIAERETAFTQISTKLNDFMFGLIPDLEPYSLMKNSVSHSKGAATWWSAELYFGEVAYIEPIGIRTKLEITQITDKDVLANKDLLDLLNVPESGKAITTDDRDVNLYRWVWIKVFPNKEVLKERYESGHTYMDSITADDLAECKPTEENVEETTQVLA